MPEKLREKILSEGDHISVFWGPDRFVLVNKRHL